MSDVKKELLDAAQLVELDDQTTRRLFALMLNSHEDGELPDKLMSAAIGFCAVVGLSQTQTRELFEQIMYRLAEPTPPPRWKAGVDEN